MYTVKIKTSWSGLEKILKVGLEGFKAPDGDVEDLNWKSLEDRRKIAKLTMMYKLVNGLVLVNTEDRQTDRISRNNNTKAYQISSCRTDPEGGP
jgi:hypothetical protein